MTSSVPVLLVAVLLMAALLGVLIGVAASSLWQRRRSDAAVEAEARSADAHADALAESAERLRRAEGQRDELREALVAARSGERDAVARHEALRMHARTLGRRLEALLSEQRASEERQIRLERALRVQREEYRLVDATAANARPDARRAAGSIGTRADGDVPVLGRRVGGEGGGPGVGKVPPGGFRSDRSARPDAGHAVPGAAAESLGSGARSVTGEGASEDSRSTSRSASRTAPRLGSGRLARSSARARTGSSVDEVSAMPALDGDEYPALSEAELPDSIDALEFVAPRVASTSR